ncbi:RNA-binding protein, putative [Plasmodium vinckei brucechwatti]|uniref:RNA-binding protein, putative n=1 Tax=Plasmodium vinckei brucechwatti TaxID=119398 RepID=A0A6V7RZM7_PLAVN|nr:RNA-binding protein, putative [Plasmodium vinckei brucechwatti]
MGIFEKKQYHSPTENDNTYQEDTTDDEEIKKKKLIERKRKMQHEKERGKHRERGKEREEEDEEEDEDEKEENEKKHHRDRDREREKRMRYEEMRRKKREEDSNISSSSSSDNESSSNESDVKHKKEYSEKYEKMRRERKRHRDRSRGRSRDRSRDKYKLRGTYTNVEVRIKSSKHKNRSSDDEKIKEKRKHKRRDREDDKSKDSNSSDDSEEEEEKKSREINKKKKSIEKGEEDENENKNESDDSNEGSEKSSVQSSSGNESHRKKMRSHSRSIYRERRRRRHRSSDRRSRRDRHRSSERRRRKRRRDRERERRYKRRERSYKFDSPPESETDDNSDNNKSKRKKSNFSSENPNSSIIDNTNLLLNASNIANANLNDPSALLNILASNSSQSGDNAIANPASLLLDARNKLLDDKKGIALNQSPLNLLLNTQSLQQLYKTALGIGELGLSTIDANAEKTARELYVGNIPQNIDIQEIVKFLNTCLLILYNKENENESICLKACIRGDTRYAFVEFRSLQDTSNCMLLNGIYFYSNNLRIGRPKTFPAEYTKLIPPATIPPIDTYYLSQGLIGIKAFVIFHQNRDETKNEYLPVDMIKLQKLCVSNISKNNETNKIKELLEAFGEIQSFEFFEGEENSDTYICLVEYNNVENAIQAHKILNQNTSYRIQFEYEIVNDPTINQLVKKKYMQNKNSILSQQIPTKVVVLSKIATFDELSNPEDYKEISEDIKIECEKYGPVLEVVLPLISPETYEYLTNKSEKEKNGNKINEEGVSSDKVNGTDEQSNNDSVEKTEKDDNEDEQTDQDREHPYYDLSSIGCAFIYFETIEGATKTRKELSGRKFGANIIEANYYSEKKFLMKNFKNVKYNFKKSHSSLFNLNLKLGNCAYSDGSDED